MLTALETMTMTKSAGTQDTTPETYLSPHGASKS